MDPFVQAARRFTSRCAMFWKLGKRPVLRAVAPLSHAADLAQVLRWEEAQPECRRPLVIVEDSFAGDPAYFEAVTRRILEAYAVLRTAAQEAGTALSDVAGVVSAEPVVAAVQTAEKAAANLPATLDGLTIALVPGRVQEPGDWAVQIAGLVKAVKALSPTGPDAQSPRVHWIVHESPGGALAGVLGSGVELVLDDSALFAWWRDSASRPRPGPTARPMDADSAARGEAPVPASALRSAIAGAVETLRANDPGAAIASLRSAQAICAEAGRAEDEAAVLVALGGAQLVAQVPRDAAVSYRAASELAKKVEEWSLSCQAKLGEAGAELVPMHHRAAASAYVEAADLAERAGSAPLRIEALRMAGLCHLLGGDKQDTVRHWRTAVDAGLELDAGSRERTSFVQVANDLPALLHRLGMKVQAIEIERRIAGASGAPPELLPAADRADPYTVSRGAAAHATQRIPILMPRSALPFVRDRVDRGAGNGPANATRPVQVRPDAKPTPFVEGTVDPDMFRKPPDDTLEDTLDEGDDGA